MLREQYTETTFNENRLCYYRSMLIFGEESGIPVLGSLGSVAAETPAEASRTPRGNRHYLLIELKIKGTL